MSTMADALQDACCPLRQCIRSAKHVAAPRRVLELGRIASEFAQQIAGMDIVGKARVDKEHPGRTGAKYKRGWTGVWDRMVDTDGVLADRELKATSMARMRLFYPIASALRDEDMEDSLPPCVPYACPELDALMQQMTPAQGDAPDEDALKAMRACAVAALSEAARSNPSRRGAEYRDAVGAALGAMSTSHGVDLGTHARKKPAARKRTREVSEIKGTPEFVQAVAKFREEAGGDEDAIGMLQKRTHIPDSVASIVDEIVRASGSVNAAQELLQGALASLNEDPDL